LHLYFVQFQYLFTLPIFLIENSFDGGKWRNGEAIVGGEEELADFTLGGVD
jgi:hypothetical protein